MATFHNGFKDIEVKLIDAPENIDEKATEFNEWGSENFSLPAIDEDEFADKFVKGKTFPKYVLEACRVSFCIKGISRICLAQLTRDNAIFCSESHGLRPLNMDFNIPLCIATDESIMNKIKQAQSILEDAYIESCEKEYPYPETRYIGLHAQTINVNASYTIGAFVRACYSRTNNSFCDELNYVYRKMFLCVEDWIYDNNTTAQKILKHIINRKTCIDDSYYTRTNVYNGDFSCDVFQKSDYPAQNDWRKSGWKMELERMLNEEPELLTEKEKMLITAWKNVPEWTIPTSYDSDEFRVAKNAIKTMTYYKEKHND